MKLLPTILVATIAICCIVPSLGSESSDSSFGPQTFIAPQPFVAPQPTYSCPELYKLENGNECHWLKSIGMNYTCPDSGTAEGNECFISRRICVKDFQLRKSDNKCERSLLTAKCQDGYDYVPTPLTGLTGECFKIVERGVTFTCKVGILNGSMCNHGDGSDTPATRTCLKGVLGVSGDECYESVIGPKPILHCDGGLMKEGEACDFKQVIRSFVLCDRGLVKHGKCTKTDFKSFMSSYARTIATCPNGYAECLDHHMCSRPLVIHATGACSAGKFKAGACVNEM